MKRFLLSPYYAFKVRRAGRQLDDETRLLTALGFDEEWTEGFDLHEVTGLDDKRMYNALVRLERADMVKVEWEIQNIPKKYRRRRNRSK